MCVKHILQIMSLNLTLIATQLSGVFFVCLFYQIEKQSWEMLSNLSEVL